MGRSSTFEGKGELAMDNRRFWRLVLLSIATASSATTLTIAGTENALPDANLSSLTISIECNAYDNR